MTKGVGLATSREPEASSVSGRPLLVHLVRLLLLAAGVFAGVQFVLELVAWVNRAAAVSGKTDAEVRATIIGDIAPFLEHAAKQIPRPSADGHPARVLLVTNESPWRARYLLLPRPVYVYHGSLPRPEDLEGKFLTEEQAWLHQLGISWVVYYTRTTTGPYRIIDSAVVPVASSAASPTGAAPGGPAPPYGDPTPDPAGLPPLGEGKGEGANGEAAEERQAGRGPLRFPVAGTLAALMVTVLAGGAVLGLIEPRRRLLSYESLALAYGLGTGCMTLALFLLSWLGFPLRCCPLVIVLAGVLGFGALVASRLRRRGAGGHTARPQSGRPASPRAASPPGGLAKEGGEVRGRNRWLRPLLVTCLLLLFLSQGYYTSTFPLNAMDAMGFWGYSAKAIYYDGTVRTPAITDPLREHPHPRYPLLVPLAQVWVHLVRGGYEDKAVKLLFVGFYVALAGVVYGAGKSALSGSSRGSPQATHAGLAAALLVATLPPLRADGYGAAFALADIPLACYIASALLCWVRWAGCPSTDTRGAFRALLLASLFGCFAAWTKNEGLAFFAILTVLTALRAGVQWRWAAGPTSAVGGTGASPRPHRAGGRREHPCAWDARALALRVPVPPPGKRSIHVNFHELGRSAGALAGGWLLLVPWLLFRHSLPVADENYPAHLQLAVLWANLGRLPVVLLTWLREFADASQWSLLWLLAAVAAVWALRRRRGRALWLLAFGFSQLLVYTVVTVVAPWDVNELLSLTSTRLLLHVLPAAVLLSVILVGALRQAQGTLSSPKGALWTEDQRTRPPAEPSP